MGVALDEICGLMRLQVDILYLQSSYVTGFIRLSKISSLSLQNRLHNYRYLKVNNMHRNHSIHTQSDFYISPHNHNTCYLEDCMVDIIVILYAAHCVIVILWLDVAYILYVVLEHYNVVTNES